MLRDACDREVRRRCKVAGGLRFVAAVAHDATPLRVRERAKDIVEPILRELF
jgi:hypothetical protein